MYYGQKPLFPPMDHDCDPGACVRVPLFGPEKCRGPMGPCCQKVILENPCRPGECAEVLLGVDECGNLTVCVHRDSRWDCGCRPPCPPPCPPSCPPVWDGCRPPRKPRKMRC
ncbi:MAG: hypothetical protein IKM02_04530 [Clostridia bacterium]|nr:hypothetical protein [Clostridia bacterium]